MKINIIVMLLTISSIMVATCVTAMMFWLMGAKNPNLKFETCPKVLTVFGLATLGITNIFMILGLTCSGMGWVVEQSVFLSRTTISVLAGAATLFAIFTYSWHVTRVNHLVRLAQIRFIRGVPKDSLQKAKKSIRITDIIFLRRSTISVVEEIVWYQKRGQIMAVPAIILALVLGLAAFFSS